ncbi:MAG: cytochrome c biogenesis protein ResB [Acidobacteria bacterium]|nr:cytochrome c biogenesis protein ResB [Acidobacteriota bacterium]
MSTLQETGNEIIVASPAEEKTGEPFFRQFFEFISSVRFGIVLLIIVGLLCFLGMILMQQNVDGFDRYYAALTPAQKLVYGTLGLFDIYSSWYFKAALVALSLNIVLSSIERFPKTWKFVASPKLSASAKWLKGQEQSESFETAAPAAEALAARIAESAKKAGWRKTRITEKGGKTFIFAESGVWNRFAYLAVHVGLLVIFAGGSMTAWMGNTGQMSLQPGQNSNEIYEMVSDLDQLNQVRKRLPFEVTCTDIQQKLIKKDDTISAMNTIDWLTKIQIKDETGVHEGTVQMNRPFDYRGYRFFQSSFIPVGRARTITVQAKSAATGETQSISIPRNGTAALGDGTEVRFVDFRGNFSLGKEDPNEDTSGYPNPGAILQITPAGGSAQTAYAFNGRMANIPIASKPIAGYTFQLTDFEKVGDAHVLSVQRDPGANVVYAGFILLFLTLVAVFFFSHQRVWASVEKATDGNFTVTLGGNTNRNQTPFSEKFKRFAVDLRN